eukprot:721968-Alexandrium_andersonii.AAC.1
MSASLVGSEMCIRDRRGARPRPPPPCALGRRACPPCCGDRRPIWALSPDRRVVPPGRCASPQWCPR